MGSKTDQLNVLYTTTVNDDFTKNTGSLPLEIRTYKLRTKELKRVKRTGMNE